MTDTNTEHTDAGGNLVERTVRISARRETVWKYWTEPARMREWWGVAAELDPRPGGVCRIEMAGGPIMRGEYVELDPFDRLVFTFGYEPTEQAPPIAPGATRVEVTFVEEAGDTVMTLRHTGIPNGFAVLHAAGWSSHLPALITAASASST